MLSRRFLSEIFDSMNGRSGRFVVSLLLVGQIETYLPRTGMNNDLILSYCIGSMFFFFFFFNKL